MFLANDYLVLDFEIDTGHGDFGHPRYRDNKMLLACWKRNGSASRCKFGGEFYQAQLLEAVSAAQFLVCHNCKYELGWLSRMGVDLHDVIGFDTMLGEYVLLGNLAAGSEEMGLARTPLDLGSVCERRGLPAKDPVVDVLIERRVNPKDIPRPWLLDRCRRDVCTTEQIFLQQRAELEASGRLPVAYTRNLVTPLLASIEQEGMAVDEREVERLYQEHVVLEQRLLGEMAALTGGANSRSVPQMAHFLYSPEPSGLAFAELTNRSGQPVRGLPSKQFPNGTPKTDRPTLEQLRATTPRQRQFLKLRSELGRIQALLSKNLNFFHGVAKESPNGVFFGEILQTATATHRTSSRGVPLVFDDGSRGAVQFQNIPRTLKTVIRAKRAGWQVADIDAAQAEFRAAAILGNDPQAALDISNPGFDSHIFTATELFGKTEEEVRADKKAADLRGSDSLRQKAKPHTFKPLYGGKSGTPAEQRYYAAFRKRYPGIADTQEAWIREAVETKQLRTPWGLIYYFPTAYRSSTGRVNVETSISNYPIQGFATGEVAQIAAVYLWHLIHAERLDDQMRIVNVVHDSSPTEVNPAFADDLVRLSKEAYTTAPFNFLKHVYSLDVLAIPLGVSIKIGDRWSSGTEQSWDRYADGREVKRK